MISSLLAGSVSVMAAITCYDDQVDDDPDNYHNHYGEKNGMMTVMVIWVSVAKKMIRGSKRKRRLRGAPVQE